LGRGPEIPEQSALGKLGALRYDPGSQDNQAIVINPVQLTGPTDLHVDGSRNILELAGVISGAHPITKSGGGTLRLSADNRAYTQPVQIENGTIALAGPIGSPVNLAAWPLAGPAKSATGMDLSQSDCASSHCCFGLGARFRFRKHRVAPVRTTCRRR
jgi:autotransporter-associated beta strand protein